jgi:dihydrofolate reductase
LKKIIIAAVSLNYVIGKDGKIPWNSERELIYFKNATMGFPVLMGRKTWETLKYPLKNRKNIILSRNSNFSFFHPNVVIYNSISDAVNYCEYENFEKLFIIGGEEVYNQTIELADEIILSIMKFEIDGDKFFPKIEKDKWKLAAEIDEGEFLIKHFEKIL